MLTKIGNIRHEHLKTSRISGGDLVRTQWPHSVLGVGTSISNQRGNTHRNQMEIKLSILLVDLHEKPWSGPAASGFSDTSPSSLS